MPSLVHSHAKGDSLMVTLIPNPALSAALPLPSILMVIEGFVGMFAVAHFSAQTAAMCPTENDSLLSRCKAECRRIVEEFLARNEIEEMSGSGGSQVEKKPMSEIVLGLCLALCRDFLSKFDWKKHPQAAS